MMSLAARQDELHTNATFTYHADPVALADACRDAGLAFLNHGDRWGKAQLGMWLASAYAPLTEPRGTYTRRRDNRETVTLPSTPRRVVDPCAIERIIRDARAEVLEKLQAARAPQSGARFAFSMLSRGFVARREFAPGRLGWRPTTGARRLADRVLSLFAVDYLARPSDYDDAFSTCSCGVMVIGASACSRDARDHGSNATFPPRPIRTTLPYFTEAA